MFALADRFLIAKHQQKLNLVREVGHQWVFCSCNYLTVMNIEMD